MTWLTWRQLRVSMLAVYVLAAAAVLALAVTGPHVAALADATTSIYDHLSRSDRNVFYAGIVVLAAAPALVGAFWGAPIVARELEQGTHRLVWSQSVTRSRWLLTRLGLTALAAAVVVGALTLAVTWWSSPLDGAQSSSTGSLPARLTPVAFAMRGVVPVAYTVFAVVLGATLGAVVRRTLPAMALTLAVVAFVQIAVPLWVRPQLVSPSHRTVALTRDSIDGISANEKGQDVHVTVQPVSPGDWVLSNRTLDPRGHANGLPAWFASCLPAPPAAPPPSGATRVEGSGKSIDTCITRLASEGYQQALVYQPRRNFWPLQWVETALYLGVSALLAGACFWWTTRRLG